MQTNESDDRPGEDKHMEGKESRQRIAGNNWTAQKQIHNLRPDDRDSTRDGCADANSPIGVGIKSHYLTGEREPQRQKQQDHSGDPGQFSWMLISAPEKNLRHVEKHDHDHAVRPPVMHGTQEPAEFLLVIEKLQTLVRLTCRRDINQSQQDPSQYLDREAKESHTPKNIKPACAAFRDRVTGGRLPMG